MKNFALLDKRLPLSPSVNDNNTVASQPSLGQNTYAELIQRLFVNRPAVVAFIGAGPRAGVSGICEEIASELASLGKRVVLVSVQALLQSSPIALPDETTFTPGPARPGSTQTYWLWPSLMGQQVEFFKSRMSAIPEKWLDSLRRNFDSVLLDCPAVETMPGGAAIGAMADAAVLVVEAAQTSKHQILRDERALQLSGVKLAGCILIQTL
jgi:hypothetical protein